MDGYCDNENNVEKCDYDGGDCCPGDDPKNGWDQYCKPHCACLDLSCKSNSDCTFDHECGEDDKCVKVTCEGQQCAANAQCKASNHQAICVCNVGYGGDPYEGCQGTACKHIFTQIRNKMNIRLHVSLQFFRLLNRQSMSINQCRCSLQCKRMQMQ